MNYWETPDFQAMLKSVRYESESRARIETRGGLTIEVLCEREWSRRAIRQRLGKPTSRVLSTHSWKYVYWYKMSRIVAAEKTPGWRRQRKMDIQSHTLLDADHPEANGWRVRVWVYNGNRASKLYISRRYRQPRSILLEGALWMKDRILFTDSQHEYLARELLSESGINIPSELLSTVS